MERDPLVVNIQGQLTNQHQIQDFPSDHASLNFEMGIISWWSFVYSWWPCSIQVLWAKHDALVISHFGFNKTMGLVSLYYWWPQLWKYVKEFVGSCVCVRVKNLHHHPHELLQPLPIPFTPWFSISMDFIIDLPLSNSFDSTSMVVDYLTNMAHFIPCNKSIFGARTTKLFLNHVFWYHGLPGFLPWTSTFGIQVLEEVFWVIKHEDEIVIGLPPPNRWANMVG